MKLDILIPNGSKNKRLFEHGKVTQTKQVKQFKNKYIEKITDVIYHRWNISTINTAQKMKFSIKDFFSKCD